MVGIVAYPEYAYRSVWHITCWEAMRGDSAMIVYIREYATLVR